MPKRRPKRLTPAQADALNRDMTPEQFRAALARMLAELHAAGVDAEEMTDAAGRSFISFDMDQLRAKRPALAARLDAVDDVTPLPQGRLARRAKTI